jgi:hypothetical protein
MAGWIYRDGQLVPTFSDQPGGAFVPMLAGGPQEGAEPPPVAIPDVFKSLMPFGAMAPQAPAATPMKPPAAKTAPQSPPLAGVPDFNSYFKKYGVEGGSEMEQIVRANAMMREMARDQFGQQKKSASGSEMIGAALQAAGNALAHAKTGRAVGPYSIADQYTNQTAEQRKLSQALDVDNFKTLTSNVDAMMKSRFAQAEKQKQIRKAMEAAGLASPGGDAGAPAATPNLTQGPIAGSAAQGPTAQMPAPTAQTGGPSNADRAEVFALHGLPDVAKIYEGRAAPEREAAKMAAEAHKRADLAKQYGMDPSTDPGRNYILTGRIPSRDDLSVASQKAVLEADELVESSRNAIGLLKTAKQLSAESFDGAAADKRAWAASQLKTRELDNLIKEQALQQLKGIFGAAPTEGERKILLDIQGSVNLPRAVRENLYDRAAQMAEKRLKFNEERAGQLRSGQYFQPRTSPAASADAKTEAPAPKRISTEADYNTLPSKSRYIDPDGTERIKK